MGFRFSAVFGFFETGNFDITIPVKSDIKEVILKTSMSETPIWNVETGSIFQSERDGVYVKLERNDVNDITMSYDGFGGGENCADYTTLESGEYFFMDNDIMMASKGTGAPVPFTISVKDANETTVASGKFFFDASVERMYLTVTVDGKIIEDTDHGQEKNTIN